jgi:hypothetical protein
MQHRRGFEGLVYNHQQRMENNPFDPMMDLLYPKDMLVVQN